MLALSDTVTGVIFASVFTITGVLVTNLVTAWNTGRQLKHDREEKAKERKLALRREIYLGAAEALQDAINGIVRYADLNLQHRDIVASFTRSSHFLAKLHVVAGPELVDAVTAVVQRTRQAQNKVRLMRNPLLDIQARMNYHRKRFESHQEFGDRTLNELKMATASAPEGSETVDALRRTMEMASELRATQKAAREALGAQLRAGMFEMVRAAFEEEHAITPMLLPVIVAARKELGEEIDMTVYSRVLERTKPLDQDTLAKLIGVASPT